jgi:hypothetical protein
MAGGEELGGVQGRCEDLVRLRSLSNRLKRAAQQVALLELIITVVERGQALLLLCYWPAHLYV